MDSIISEFFERSKFPSKKQFHEVLKQNGTYQQYLLNGFTTDDLYYLIKRKLPIEKHYCVVCGNVVHVKNSTYGFASTCSPKCTKQLTDKTISENNKKLTPIELNEIKLRKSEKLKTFWKNVSEDKRSEIIKKRKETNNKRYGGNSPAHSKVVIDKIKSTNKRKYGVDSPMKSPQIKEKFKKTMLNRYGKDNPIAVEQFKLKAKSSLFKNHGVTSTFQLSTVKQKAIINSHTTDADNKRKSTNLQRYGNEYVIGSEFGVKQRSETNLRKYGNICSLHGENVQKKVIETNLKHFGATHHMKNPEVAESVSKTFHEKSYDNQLQNLKWTSPCFDKDEWFGRNEKDVYRWRCKKCGEIFEAPIKSYDQYPRCRKCFSQSFMEEELRDFIKSIYHGEIRRDRKILNGKEIDIFLPELSIGIEFNGDYWHSPLCGKDKFYHLEKTIACEEREIRLFHVFESVWRNSEKEIKQLLTDVINGKISDPVDDVVVMDRGFPIYNAKQLENYSILDISEPRLVDGSVYGVFDCGVITFKKELENIDHIGIQE